MPRSLLLLALLTACGKGSDDSTETTPGTTSGTAGATTTGSAAAGAPVADDDEVLVAEAGTVLIDVLANDTDPDDAIDPFAIEVVDPPSAGTAVVEGDRIRYTHDGSETGDDAFTYVLGDVLGHRSEPAEVTVSIDAINDPPVADDDASVVDEGGVVVIAVTSNDSDADGVLDLSTATLVGAVTGGSVVFSNGVATFTHDGSEGTFAWFRYTVADVQGTFAPAATVEIDVDPMNDPPEARDDGEWCKPGQPKGFAVLENDLDPDSKIDWSTVQISTPPTAGTAVADASTGTVLYTHDGSATVADVFGYRVSDLEGALSNEAFVSLEIADYVAPKLVGSYRVNQGPYSWYAPPVYSCVEACALVFGGFASDYDCSTTGVFVDHQAKAARWGYGGCTTVAEDFKEGPNGLFTCAVFAGCATSAYVYDNCTYDNTNYCWER